VPDTISPKPAKHYASVNMIEIRWQEPASNGGSNLTHYLVEWDEGRGNGYWYSLGQTLGYTTFTVSSGNSIHFKASDTYLFRVLGVNAVGQSEWSE
jgi:hypothetical protein